MFHSWGKKLQRWWKQLSRTSTCTGNRRPFLLIISLMQLTTAHRKVSKYKFGLSLALLLLLLFALPQRRISSLQEIVIFLLCTLSPLQPQPILNQLAQNDQGWKKLQEGKVFQHTFRDEILQTVVLTTIHPTQTRKISRPRALNHSLADLHFKRKEDFCKQHGRTAGSYRLSTNILARVCSTVNNAFRNTFSLTACQQQAFSSVTETGILWKCSQEMTCFNLSCHFQYCLSLRSLSRKDGAMFKYYPLPSCKFLYCFYSLSQAGESQTESEILFSLYDSLVEHRNNNASIHLKEVTVPSRFTNFHVFLVQELEIPQPTFSAPAWFRQTMEVLFQSRFLLHMKHNAIRTQIPTPILSPTKQMQTLCQKPAILQDYQLTGRKRVTSSIQRAAASYGKVAPGLRLWAWDPRCIIFPPPPPAVHHPAHTDPAPICSFF